MPHEGLLNAIKFSYYIYYIIDHIFTIISYVIYMKDE